MGSRCAHMKSIADEPIAFLSFDRKVQGLFTRRIEAQLRKQRRLRDEKLAREQQLVRDELAREQLAQLAQSPRASLSSEATVSDSRKRSMSDFGDSTKRIKTEPRKLPLDWVSDASSSSDV